MENIERKIGTTTLRVGLPEDNDPKAQRMGVSLDLEDGSTHSHVFNNFGAGDWRSFLCSLDSGYVGDKFYGGRSRQDSLQETIKNIQSDMKEYLEEAMMSRGSEVKAEARDKVRDFREKIAECRRDFRDEGSPTGSPTEQVAITNLVSSYAREFSVDSPGSLVGQRENPAFKKFMRQVWSPMAAELKRELEAEKTVEEEVDGPGF
ncbi:MAG: hypothetical protein ABJN42_29790 [Roseibium sp.]|uniref:hypothetical protein n=1 Tax=Roseibium sp. TaxID=1936156 RepID=UPI0032979848